jgi:hypothetical protein
MFRDLFRRMFRRREPGEIDTRPTRDRLLTHPAGDNGRHASSEAFDAGLRAGGGNVSGHL